MLKKLFTNEIISQQSDKNKDVKFLLKEVAPSYNHNSHYLIGSYELWTKGFKKPLVFDVHYNIPKFKFDYFLCVASNTATLSGRLSDIMSKEDKEALVG